MPALGGYLLAKAIPRHKGRAIRNTLKPATTSFINDLFIQGSQVKSYVLLFL